TNDVSGPVSNRNLPLPAGFDNATGAGLIQAPDAIRLGISSPLTCNGQQATVYVLDGVIVGGALDGSPYDGTLVGTNRNDVISGTNVDDTIRGGNGNDLICGFGRNDTINGQNGEDIIFGGDGDDEIRGANSNDTLFGEAGEDILLGNNGDDILAGGDDIDFCNGGRGDDVAVDCENVNRATSLPMPLDVCWIDNPNGNTSAWRITNDNPGPLIQSGKVVFDWSVYAAGSETPIQSVTRQDNRGEVRVNTPLAERITVSWYIEYESGIETQIWSEDVTTITATANVDSCD
ncbi:MAG: calcium-binding protein, partial [Chloroflexota bacterium]